MFRSANPGVAGASEDRLESLKRHFYQEENDTLNGLSMNLQDQYDQHDEPQAKRQRNAGPSSGAGPMMGQNGNGMMNNAMFGQQNNMMQQMQQMQQGMQGGGNQMGGPQGMSQMNQLQGMQQGNHLQGGGSNFMFNSMQLQGMQGGGNMMNAGGFSHLNAQGMPSAFSSAMENDIAAAFYLNNFDGSGSGMGMQGLLGQCGAGLGFAAMAQGGSLGGLLPSGAGGNPFGGYGRMPDPYGSLAGTHAGFSQGTGSGSSAAANAAAMGGLPGSNARRAQLMALMDMESELQQQQEAAKVGSGNFPAAAGPGPTPDFMSAQRGNGMGAMGMGGSAAARREESDGGNSASGPTQIPEPPMDLPTFSTATTPAVLPLPPVIEEGAAAHYSQRAHIPLGIDEDNNWLTEFQCFIRFDLIEVVQASRHADQSNGASGGNKNNGNGGETFQQVGVRCRYCAHLHPGQRASRSSAFPSSIRQLYQSFTMMLRDHFEQCSEIPPLRKKLFSELKAKNSQGAYDSKQYWIYAAEKLGMIDSEHGIQMTAESQAKARRKPPFGTVGDTPHTHSPPKLLVSPDDMRITSDFLYTLMSQVQVVHLIDSERVGKRKTLRVGLPGFGCRYCCHVGRCGLSRMFPLRRRMLPGKVNEIYEHVKRCTLFPTKEKDLLARLKGQDKTGPEQEKEFFDRVWERLGCESEVKK